MHNGSSGRSNPFFLRRKFWLSGCSWAMLAATGLLATFPAGSALAQEGNASTAEGGLGEIIVTARKKAESLQDVPVAVTAFDAATLERGGINNMEDLGRNTPGLVIESGRGAVGGSTSLRGVSTGDLNYGADQAVAINIDGVQIEASETLRVGFIDLQQVEILKGPQALFFGKNSSGGVIALKTKDPTDELFVQGRFGYEFEAEEKIGEVIVSGPLTDTLGARAVAYYSSLNGFFKNNATPSSIADSKIPNVDELIARMTLKWEPNSDLKVRGKYTYSKVNGNKKSLPQKIYCPDPTRVRDDCKKNHVLAISDPSSFAAGLDAGTPPEQRKQFDHVRMNIASLDVDYQVSDSLNLSSVTGYYDIMVHSLDAGNPYDISDPDFGLINEPHQDRMGVSEELRLATDFDGSVNYMLGFYYGYQKLALSFNGNFVGIADQPNTRQEVKSDTFSGFGQANWAITEDLDLSGGARYSKSKRKYRGVLRPANTQLIPRDDTLAFDNISPEATLSWRPVRGVMLYGAYKQGFKSGTFDISALPARLIANPGSGDLEIDDETARGGEVGFKTMLADNTLRINGTAYYYDYKGLQLTLFDPISLSTRTDNAGAARVKGFEVEALWSPYQLEGFTLSAGVNYNHARYLDYITDCNDFQRFGGGVCPLDIKPNVPGPDSQSLAGQPLRIAPDWTVTGGFSYERPVADDGFGFRIGANAIYRSDYHTSSTNEPLGVQGEHVLLDGHIDVMIRGVELSLVGRNLTNVAVNNRTSSQPFTALSGPGGSDLIGVVSRGRELLLQLTIRPFEL